jgi:seryl-tRNA synthetase
MSLTMPAATPAEATFLAELIEHRLLIPTSVPGLFGRGTAFEDVIERFDDYVTRSAADDGAERLRFPPVVTRADLEKSEYLKSFPQLAGSVFSFTGTSSDHQRLLDLIHEGKDWSQYQTITDVVMTPAACYPLYPMCSGTLRDGGRLFDVLSYCFRHEPSPDPARMQLFRQREFVRICAPGEALPWRDRWLERGLELLTAVGLPVASDVANDPFFGRGGKMLSINQRDQKLKYEVLIPICSSEQPTAILSVNCHLDHFGLLFGIRMPDGAPAHTACVGFGLERIALALLKTHGLLPKKWPSAVRGLLWP